MISRSLGTLGLIRAASPVISGANPLIAGFGPWAMTQGGVSSFWYLSRDAA